MKTKLQLIDTRSLDADAIERAYDALPPGDQYEIDLYAKKLIAGVKIRNLQRSNLAKVGFGLGQAMEVLAKLGIWMVNTPIPAEPLSVDDAGRAATDHLIRTLGPAMPMVKEEQP